MVKFTATILKFCEQGEKTGWTYFIIPAEIALQLLPHNKKSFRVKGKLDEHVIKGMALLPMGEGDFIMALNADVRKRTGKKKGHLLQVQLELDTVPYEVNKTLMECLKDEPKALSYFESLPTAHKNYFSKWIESAKTTSTRTKRIMMTVNAMLKKMNFPEMLRAAKIDDDLLLL